MRFKFVCNEFVSCNPPLVQHLDDDVESWTYVERIIPPYRLAVKGKSCTLYDISRTAGFRHSGYCTRTVLVLDRLARLAGALDAWNGTGLLTSRHAPGRAGGNWESERLQGLLVLVRICCCCASASVRHYHRIDFFCRAAGWGRLGPVWQGGFQGWRVWVADGHPRSGLLPVIAGIHDSWGRGPHWGRC